MTGIDGDAEAEPSELADCLAAAQHTGLVYVSDSEPGIRRVRNGRGFRYVGAGGIRVTAEDRARIRALAIPPAYVSVWICARADGHLQATGRDARGRKQYRYHPLWRTQRDAGKFDRMLAFGQCLPRLRRRVRRDLMQVGLSREKVLAAAVQLLATTMLRIGNDEYARDNRSYGLTTLRCRHARKCADGMRLRFRGKGGKQHDIAVNDKRLVRILRRCQMLPGQLLFQYVDDEAAVRSIDSGMVNQYLKDATGESFTAKDFRTWGGTLSALMLLARTPFPDAGGERALAQSERAVVVEVAQRLGNTPAVCRASYIHPIVFSLWRDGTLHRAMSTRAPAGVLQWEAFAISLLKRGARPRRRARGNS